MSKEQDLRNEILSVCPLLSTFLNDASPSRQTKLDLYLASNVERMNETKGKDYITATIVTATSILKFQRSFGPARTEKDALRILEHTALLVAIGFEIGDNFGDTHSVVLFVDEVTERAVSDGMIKEEESSSENLPFRKVGGLLAKGFVMAHENDPNLKAFEDFLKKLG